VGRSKAVSSPLSRRKDSARITMVRLNALAESFWHSRQWQATVTIGSSLTS